MSPRVLSFHYILTNDAGTQIDTSRQGEPFPVMEGAHQIIPGLEEELFKMQQNEKKTVRIPAEKAYGPIVEQLKIKVNRSRLPAGEIKVGSQFHGGDQTNHLVFTVTGVEGDEISLDGNHPLAGQPLTFEVEVMSVREATEQELAHGHAHGPEGHSH